jgi:hypothetical protein
MQAATVRRARSGWDYLLLAKGRGGTVQLGSPQNIVAYALLPVHGLDHS